MLGLPLSVGVMHALAAPLLDADGHELRLTHADTDDDRSALLLALTDANIRALSDAEADVDVVFDSV